MQTSSDMEKQNPPAYAAHAAPIQSSAVPAVSYPEAAAPQVATYPQQGQMVQYGASPQAYQPYSPPPSTVFTSQSPAIPYQAYVQPIHSADTIQHPTMIYSKPQMEASISGTTAYDANKSGAVVTQQPLAGNAPQGTMYSYAMPLETLGESPAPVDCPSCHQRALTHIYHKTGDCTHLWALGACIVGHIICLCVVPYLVNSFKDTVHKCSRCGIMLATHKKSGGTQVHAFGMTKV